MDADPDPTSSPRRPGRRRDPSRDLAILSAALEVLADVGYEGLTMDAVAERAKAGKATLYRRWSSKEELLLAAVHHLRGGPIDEDDLPDTGSLRADLLALFRPDSVEATDQRFRVILGLTSLLVRGGELRHAVEEVLASPWTDAYRTMMRRAAERGEIPASADLDTIAQVVPAVAAHRTLVQQRPFDREFLVTMIDHVILPALHGAPVTGQRPQGDGPAG